MDEKIKYLEEQLKQTKEILESNAEALKSTSNMLQVSQSLKFQMAKGFKSLISKHLIFFSLFIFRRSKEKMFCSQQN